MTASADSIGSLEARMVLRSCPVFGQNWWSDSIYPVHQSVDVGCARTGHDFQWGCPLQLRQSPRGLHSQMKEQQVLHRRGIWIETPQCLPYLSFFVKLIFESFLVKLGESLFFFFFKYVLVNGVILLWTFMIPFGLLLLSILEMSGVTLVAPRTTFGSAHVRTTVFF